MGPELTFSIYNDHGYTTPCVVDEANQQICIWLTCYHLIKIDFNKQKVRVQI